MRNGVYLDRHLWIHLIDRPDGLEEVNEEPKEEVRLSVEGRKKMDELDVLLNAHRPSVGRQGDVVMIGCLLCIALGGLVADYHFVSHIAAAVGMALTVFVWCIACEKMFASRHRLWDTKRAIDVARFEDQNIDFLSALGSIDYDKVIEVNRLARIFDDQHTGF